MDATWIPLKPNKKKAGIPPLLAKLDFSRPGHYSIYLTDLNHIWHEELDREGIIRRALHENTSIDPSEDDKQLQILLEKIRGALSGEQGTKCFLESPLGHVGAILLRITAPLPRPLGSLQWTIRLVSCAQDTLRDHLILPLFGLADYQNRRVADLISRLSEKDHVIGKLVDKLEASGMDLSNVFPGIVIKQSIRMSLREKAAMRIKGLRTFDEQRWRRELQPPILIVSPVIDLMRDDLLRTDLGRLKAETRVSTPSGWSSQIQPAQEISIAYPALGVAQLETETDQQSQQANDDEVGDSGFQKQATPPGLQKRHSKDHLSPPRASKPNTRVTQVGDDDGTTDEEITDDPSYRERRMKMAATLEQIDPYVVHSLERGPNRKLVKDVLENWTSEGPKPPPQRLKVHSNFQSSHVGPSAAEDHSTTDDDDDDPPVPAATPPTTTATEEHSPAPARKTKLGRIGGQKNTAAENSGSTSKAATPSPKKVHNKIGGKAVPARESTRSKSPQPPPSPTPGGVTHATQNTKSPSASALADRPPESSQERADRKRAELKRELEAKSTAPAKKKRRF